VSTFSLLSYSELARSKQVCPTYATERVSSSINGPVIVAKETRKLQFVVLVIINQLLMFRSGVQKVEESDNKARCDTDQATVYSTLWCKKQPVRVNFVSTRIIPTTSSVLCREPYSSWNELYVRTFLESIVEATEKVAIQACIKKGVS
jgi:hypothetical protein